MRALEGQQSLFGEPPVKCCRGCRRRLNGRQSIARGYGPTCWRVAAGKAERRVHCRACRHRLDDGRGGVHRVCSKCGNGSGEKLFTRVEIVGKRKSKRKAKATA